MDGDSSGEQHFIASLTIAKGTYINMSDQEGTAAAAKQLEETPLSTSPRSYNHRRAPYIGTGIRLSIAAILILIALMLFQGAVSSHDPDMGSTAGWLMAPVVWLISAAYRKWKAIPVTDRIAVDLNVPRLVTRLAMGFLILTILGTALAVAIPFQQKQARSHRIKLILQKWRDLAPANTQNRLTFREILARDVSTFSELQKQCEDLQGALNQNDVLAAKRKEFLNELSPEFNNTPSGLALLETTKQMGIEDAKSGTALREMISCSKALAKTDLYTQKHFRSACITPASDTLSATWARTLTLLKQLQEKGAKLPPDILESLK
jgi:hypothetical protein